MYIRKFDILTVGGREMLVFKQKPENGDSVDDLCWVSNYAETVFEDLQRLHVPDHTKWNTLHDKAKKAYGNSIPLYADIAFSDTCPVCLRREKWKKPKAGLQPIANCYTRFWQSWAD